MDHMQQSPARPTTTTMAAATDPAAAIWTPLTFEPTMWRVKVTNGSGGDSIPPLPHGIQVPQERWNEFCLSAQTILHSHDLQTCLSGVGSILVWTVFIVALPFFLTAINCYSDALRIGLSLISVPCFIVFNCCHQRLVETMLRDRLVIYCREQEDSLFRNLGLSLQVDYVVDGKGTKPAYVVFCKTFVVATTTTKIDAVV